MAGCHAGGSAALGAGEPVNLCDGVTALNGLPEPAVTSHQAILSYTGGALRVIARIDTGRSVHTISDTTISVPATIVGALAAEKAAYQALRSRVESATTAPMLHAAVQAFTDSPAFAGADSTVELWAGNECG